MMGPFRFSYKGGVTVETALKAAICIMLTATASACLIGGVTILKKK